MGQAKHRGTFEQRQAEGIAKKQEQECKRAEALAAIEAKRTPEEREQSRLNKLLFTSVLGTMVASSTKRGLELARIATKYRA